MSVNSNQHLANYLKQLADYYFLEKDRGRMLAFAFAADKVLSLEEEVNNINLPSLRSKGIKESLLKEIESFLNKKTSDRFDQLNTKWPSNTYKQLLELFDFDIEYVNYLWQNFKCDSILKLKQVNEPRAILALTKIQNKIELSSLEFQDQFKYNTLGDVVQSIDLYYKNNLDTIAKTKSSQGHRYLFLTETLPSKNTFSDLEQSKIQSWLLDIKKAQINYGIKIWKGGLLDVSLEGEPFLKKEYLGFDFVTIKLSTRPHTDKVARLLKAARMFKEPEKIVIDCIDRYSSLEEIQAILSSGYSILVTSNIMHIYNNYGLDRLKNSLTFSNNNILIANELGDYGKEEQTKNLVAQVLNHLSVDDAKVINSKARPFSKINNINQIGTR